LQKLKVLVEYQRRHGHCQVPHNWSKNVALAQWVKCQRYQQKLREKGKHSTLSDKRNDSLDHLGFVWSSHRAILEEPLVELKAYAQIYGNCSMSIDFLENPTLAVWVKCQRCNPKINNACTSHPEITPWWNPCHQAPPRTDWHNCSLGLQMDP
jgi:hypothetical protein